MAPRTKSPVPLGTTDRQLDALLALLSDSPMLVISGGKIAKEIGVTRSTVWRWITQLRELGVQVKGHPNSGYHIERVPDILVPNILRRQLAGTPFAKRIHHFFKVDSTNRVALEQAGYIGFPGSHDHELAVFGILLEVADPDLVKLQFTADFLEMIHPARELAVVPVVWTGSGKNKLRPVAG